MTRARPSGPRSALVHLQLVLLVEAGRVAGVAHDEAGPVVVHAPLAAPHKQVPGLPQRPGAVHERGTDRSRPVAGRRAQRELIRVAPDTETKKPLCLYLFR